MVVFSRSGYKINWSDRKKWIKLIKIYYGGKYAIDFIHFLSDDGLHSKKLKKVNTKKLRKALAELNPDGEEGTLTIHAQSGCDWLFYQALPLSAKVEKKPRTKSADVKECLSMIKDRLEERDIDTGYEPIAIRGGEELNKELLKWVLYLYPPSRWYYSPSSRQLIILVWDEEGPIGTFVAGRKKFDEHSCPNFDFDDGYSPNYFDRERDNLDGVSKRTKEKIQRQSKTLRKLLVDLNADFTRWKKTMDPEEPILQHHS